MNERIFEKKSNSLLKLFKKQQLTKRAKPLELITNQAGNMERRSIMRKVPEIKRKKTVFKMHLKITIGTVIARGGISPLISDKRILIHGEYI